MTGSSDFEIVEGEGNDRTVALRWRGRLDASTAPVLLARAARIQAEGRNLVLNLAEVTFLDSSGVGAMLVLTEQFQEQAGTVRFVALSEAARTVVELLDLDRHLNIGATEAEASAKES